MGIKFGTRTEFMEQIIKEYVKLTGINPETIIRGKGYRKTIEQRYYDKLGEYTEKLKQYANHIRFQPLMEKFNKIYGKYPEYPVADTGYGNFNNYLYSPKEKYTYCGRIVPPFFNISFY